MQNPDSASSRTGRLSLHVLSKAVPSVKSYKAIDMNLWRTDRLVVVRSLKMPRWSQHTEDSFRLPEGFRRIGYDADTMRYTFADKNGKLYRGEPGEEFGRLTPVIGSASTDRPGAFSDGNNSKARESSRKLTFSDFLPPTSVASASTHNLPAPPPKAHFNGAVRTAIPKMQGVMQNLRRSITSVYTKGSTKHGSPLPPPLQEDAKSTAGSVGASDIKSKNSDTKSLEGH